MTNEVLAVVFSRARDTNHRQINLAEGREPIDPYIVARYGDSIAKYIGNSGRLTVDEFVELFPHCCSLREGIEPVNWSNEVLFNYLDLPESAEGLQPLANIFAITVVSFFNVDRGGPYEQRVRVSPSAA